MTTRAPTTAEPSRVPPPVRGPRSDDPAEVTRQGTPGGVAAVRLRIDLAYDGAPFAGFARQRDQVTVQGTLEDALERLLGHAVRTTGAGRTDRGVHALAQVVHLDVPGGAVAGRGGPPDRAVTAVSDLSTLRTRLDHLVGPAITVWMVRHVPSHFDARFSARSRAYRYRLVDAVAADPIRRGDRWHVGEALDVGAMRRALRPLLGEHDFASFCRRASGRTTVRRLTLATVSRPHAGRVDVRLAGTAFCHQQVRSIVGCLVEVGRARRPPGWVDEVLAARDRAAAARVAPPHGLTLERVGYGPGVPAAPPPGVR
jgi:tRNA pseudouridine38-40 synthase